MLVAKVQVRPAHAIFAEVLKVGPVRFDPRPGWVLLAHPVGIREKKRTLVWMHPGDVMFDWVREFNFKEDTNEVTQNIQRRH